VSIGGHGLVTRASESGTGDTGHIGPRYASQLRVYHDTSFPQWEKGVCVCLCVCVYLYIMFVCVYHVHTHTHKHTHTHTHTHTHLHIHMHTNTHTHNKKEQHLRIQASDIHPFAIRYAPFSMRFSPLSAPHTVATRFFCLYKIKMN
jgi:hypothetical protein